MFQSPTVTGSLMGLGVMIAFSGFLLALTRFLPGRTHLGAPLPDGTRVAYPMNGAPTFFITVAAYIGLGAAGVFDPVWPIRHFFDLLIGANLFSVLLSAILWWRGPERKLHTPIIGFWLGAELNPRWFDVDLKVFSYRPSLIGLELLVIAFGFAELQQNGSISLAMWLFQAFWFFYLAMTFLFEHGMLSMFDVIEERFGFMLVFGDYGLVPFFYCIGGFAILTRPEPLSVGAAVVITLLFAFGYWVFRGANGQKNQFKADPTRPIWGKAPETVGGRLLVSGFWGIGRKLNYTGEILAYVAIALTTGFHSPWPYALPLWLLSLLLHRAHRDDKRCRAKYGALWEAYCARARFRMFPFIY
ncbi:MAG: hypothetical protein IV100_06215 [Myxococcales bacterium]|nr:hypothetical protein [Myxococcales bacterium]